MSSRAIVGQLAEPDRLRVVAALALGARLTSEIADRTGLGHDQVVTALTRLLRAGLVESESGGFILQSGVFATAARAEAPRAVSDSYAGLEPALGKVLRTYLVNGRLTSIPVAAGKRRMILEYLACAFEPGHRYSEAQVNAVLRVWHDDVAALRRYLVDESLLSREDGEYWRVGGPLQMY